MNREELKAEALINLGSEPAPKEWEKLPCIKEQMPSCIGGEVSLQRFVGTDICAWFVGIGGLWEPQSDYFRVSLPPAEGAEAILKEGLDDGRYADIVDGINIDVKQPFYQAIIRYAEDVVAAQQQPTAEGAEEMFRLLAKYASRQRLADDPDLEKLLELDDLRRSVYEDHRIPTSFAIAQLIAEETVFRHVITLHAQRIADKMVEEKCKKCKYRGLPDSINEALNSGDGVYRP